MSLLVKFKKLSENAVIPKHSLKGDAGLDLIATSFSMDTFRKFDEYGTGLAIEIPAGYVGLLFPRSSISNTRYCLANSVGVIDSNYRGEIKLRFRTTGNEGLPTYGIGDKIGQLVLIPQPEVSTMEVIELSSSERGDGGFGSTGN